MKGEQAKGGEQVDSSAPATTTSEQDRKTASNRQINLTWEVTQRHIALFAIGAAVVVASYLSVLGETESVRMASLVFLFGVANNITGFYFGRTNHTKSDSSDPGAHR